MSDPALAVATVAVVIASGAAIMARVALEESRLTRKLHQKQSVEKPPSKLN